MFRRFGIALAAVVGMTLTLAACEQQEQPQSDEGEAQVVVRGLSAYSIDRMVVTARPANITQTLEYNFDAGTFSGRMVLPAGEQTLTAEGYSSSYVPPSDGGTTDGGSYDGGFVDAGTSDGGAIDAGSPSDGGFSDAGSYFDGGSTSGGTLVATGSTTVTITAGASTAVTLRIYDLTPKPPQGDIGPLIRSLQASRSTTTVGSAIQLTVDAVDLDGDALSYTWTSSCAASTFGSPYSATTSWSSSASGVCRLAVTVSSRGQSVTESVEVSVFSAPVDGGPGEGSIQVNGEYIARPYIGYVNFRGGSAYAYVYRDPYSNATLPTLQAGTTYYLDVNIDYGTRFGTFANTVETDCGGTVSLAYDSCSTGGYCTASYTWTTPASGTVCKVTMKASNGTLADSFSVGGVVR
ncbi:hypothetical protein [Archangium sp.]|uniref:hypothetical protein n=1 Tax=Archangium sp. TaxID=1872627 RepID=UPI003899BDC7